MSAKRAPEDGVRKLSVSEKLLLAAFSLVNEGAASFTAEDLVVAAWQLFPRSFGLRGHNDDNGLPLYPDSNRVFAEIMGSAPIRKRGFLEKVGKKTYALTASGHDSAAKLQASVGTEDKGGKCDSSGGKASISRPMMSKLERLLGSRAVQRAQNDELDRITFHDACVFWGITPSSSAIDLTGRLADINAAVNEMQVAVQGGASEIRSGGAELTSSTVALLKNVQEYLLDRFSTEVATIQARSDR